MTSKSKKTSDSDREARVNEATGKALKWLEEGFRIEGQTHHKVTGMSIKINPTDVLITLKAARTSEGPQVAFVASSDLRKAIRKAYAQYRDEELKWKLDEWEMRRFDDTEDYL